MWSKEQKDILSIIYGDDLILIGDVVIARDDKNETCKVIDINGNLLVTETVYGVTRVLGRGGFHYVVLTDKKEVYSNKSDSKAKNSYTMSLYTMRNIPYIDGRQNANKIADYVEYTYKIFNSKFEYERVSKVRSKSYNGKDKLIIEAGDKFYNFKIVDCILTEYNHNIVLSLSNY